MIFFERKNAFQWRLIIQWLFFFWSLFIGLQFGLFVRHFQTFGQAGYYPRPPSVEGFLPIGALISLKSLVISGEMDLIHPAALILFSTFLLMSLLAKKSFCSFICPVGTVSEGLWKIGQRLLGRNFRLVKWLDYPLQLVKYGLLLFFLKMILWDMPLLAIKGFLASPYWAVADVKMWLFFVNISSVNLVIIAVLILLSIPYRNFWCRYLCPYGALLGLFSVLSPFKIFRNKRNCTGCGSCSRSCPSLIDVQHKRRIYSPECTGCMTCLKNCPEKNTLHMGIFNHPVSGINFVFLVLFLFASGVLTGMISGHWQTSLSYQDYLQLVPMAHRAGF